MVYYETLLSYPYQKLPFTVHTYASDKQLGTIICHKNKHIAFLSIILSKPQRNYTTTKKELLMIVECLKQFQGILFGYEINVFSDHKNLVYAATLSESQRVMIWKLILKEFGPNIQHIAVFDNIVVDTLSILSSMPRDNYYTYTSKAQCRANKLFGIVRTENNEYCFLINLLIVQREKQKELINKNSKVSTYILD